MIVGIVNIDYAAFLTEDDPDIIEATVEHICDSLYMEARMRLMGYDFSSGGDEWNM